MMSRRWFVLLMVVLVMAAGFSSVQAAQDGPEEEARQRLQALPWPLVSVEMEGETLTVCLQVPREQIVADEGMGAERIEASVAGQLSALTWRTLHVQAVDASGRCRALSSFLMEDEASLPLSPAAALTKRPPLMPSTPFTRSLAGKVIFVSAGHGWQWNGSAWRTQRPPYQEIIEDHNNAEAVNQFLIPYLERAGAWVIPVRERDRNTLRTVVDDSATSFFTAPGWVESTAEGYGGHYHFAETVSSTATLTATWSMTVPAEAFYALYAWVPAAGNRAPDARYAIQHALGVSEVQLDQRIEPSTWRYLGTFPFRAGMMTVTLTNHSAFSETYVVADALRLGGGLFDDLEGISTTATSPPYRPWWESCTFYYSQWLGLDRGEWAPQNGGDFNDVVARPMYARWRYGGIDAEAIYISWHTNGGSGTARGTESYIHDGSTYPVTEGSAELQNAVHTELIHDIRVGWDPDWSDRGRKSRNLGELRLLWDDDPANRLPGTLVEIAFHDNPEDALALKEPNFNQLAARAIYQGIVHYFEQRDGVDLVELPEPPTHLYAHNLGNGAVRIGWRPSPTDTVGLVGEAATAYRLYLLEESGGWSTPITVSGTAITLTDLPLGETYYFYVTGINAGGESLPSELLGFRVGTPAVLIVNGFDKVNRFGLIRENDPVEGINLRMWMDRINRRDYVRFHGDAVPSRFAWDSASNEAVRDGLVALSNYALVDWLLGEESVQVDGVFDAEERARLTTYLEDDRGNLLLSGSEWAWWLEDAAPHFLTQTLHTAYVGDDAETYTVTGRSGTVFADVGEVRFDAPMEYDADYPDMIAPADSDGQAVMEYLGGNGGTAAIHYDDGEQCLLLFGFPLEVIRPEQRATVISRAFDACLEPTVLISHPVEGGAYPSPPSFEGWSIGEPSRVEVSVERMADGTFWDGSAWQTGEHWLTATGVLTWSYALLALDDGAYTLRARAVVGDEPTSQVRSVQILVDSTPPLAPTLLEPPDGETLTALQVAFRWQPPADDGSTLSYRLQVDGEEYASATSVYTLPLAEGTHSWRVRAVDAAGNLGSWSETQAFTLRREHVYLPTVMRNARPVLGEQTLIDSDFEEGENGWLFNRDAVRTAEAAHTGSYGVKLGLDADGQGAVSYSSIERTLTLPDGGTSTLTFWMISTVDDAFGDAYYVVLEDAAGTSHYLLTSSMGYADWVERRLDLSAYNGQTVTLFIGVKNDGDETPARLYVDDILLRWEP